MTTPSSFMQAREGMEVVTLDGVKLGTIVGIWYGQDPSDQDPHCDEATCSRLEVHRGLLRRRVLYIPYNAVADVAEKRVTLNVTGATVTEQPWDQRPSWLGPPDDPVVWTGGG